MSTTSKNSTGLSPNDLLSSDNLENDLLANDLLANDNQSKGVKPIIVTTGEPAGVGMDIVLKLAVEQCFSKLKRPVVVLADEQALHQRAKQIYGTDEYKKLATRWRRIDSLKDIDDIAASNKALTELTEKSVDFFVHHTACQATVVAGKLNVDNAAMVYEQLSIAHELACAGSVDAIVTGPIQKSLLIDAGLTLEDGTMFTGHTEFFMQKSGCEKVVMMLANKAMKVALVTTHLPLREVANAITPKNVRETVNIVINDLKHKFGLDNPKVLVCGLNPHAGEGGHLGLEEIEVINPVLKEFQNKGFDISSAMPADTLFTKRHLQHCDAVIAMYHDQGLPVLKSHGFGETVNLTLGLPYIRTSVDHGTALDLAGQTIENVAEDTQTDSKALTNPEVNKYSKVSSDSLWQALIMADDMATSQTK